MLRRLAVIATPVLCSVGAAYAAAAPDEAGDERGFPLAIVLSLVAVGCAVFASMVALRGGGPKRDD
ncbi:MAG: hypothetical protein R3C16_08565 [Hyphomonadaceae bacterium]